MTPGESRYLTVDAVWNTVGCVPAITRAEAEQASRKLCRKFGGMAGHDLQERRARPGTVRKCWVTATPGAGIARGWQRLVHDVSHRIFRYRYPGWRPHHPQHAVLELEIATYVVTQTDWLSGGLAPPPKPPLDAVADRRARLEARLVQWTLKLRRSERAVAKLKRQIMGYERRAKRTACLPEPARLS